ncbi:hypothetical protein VTO42DRAFT_9004 [Malbranchea cinnamomea]
MGPANGVNGNDNLGIEEPSSRCNGSAGPVKTTLLPDTSVTSIEKLGATSLATHITKHGALEGLDELFDENIPAKIWRVAERELEIKVCADELVLKALVFYRGRVCPCTKADARCRSTREPAYIQKNVEESFLRRGTSMWAFSLILCMSTHPLRSSLTADRKDNHLTIPSVSFPPVIPIPWTDGFMFESPSRQVRNLLSAAN